MTNDISLDRRALLSVLATSGWSLSSLAALSCSRPPPITVPPPGMRFFHPTSEVEPVELVARARREKVELRVRGSMHSVGRAIFTDAGDRNINLQLDRYNRILHWDDARKQVTVQSGIHLGIDPRNPRSNRDTSLLYTLERRGWALPDLGGITHQTVGGFLSTGSAGGTIHHDVGESVVRIRVVAGDGNVYEFSRDPSNPRDALENSFYAAGVSVGLLGILSTVTFQCVPRYDIIGRQITRSFATSPVDLFGDGDNGFRRFMERKEYNRVLVFPQKGVERVQLWEARRTTPADASTTHRCGAFEPKPLEALPEALQAIVHAIYDHVDREEPPYSEGTANFMRGALKTFMPEQEERFWDRWLTGLPMDNPISDYYMPTEFTELFVDIEKTHAVMTALRDFWAGDENMGRTGPFATEIYPGKANQFWLSPSHGSNTVRIDVFWFKTGQTNPDRKFYPQYWELLRNFGYRFHWGKHLSPGNSSTGVAFRRAGLPRWDDFLRLRERMDPNQVFVTGYWREHFGIPMPA